MVQALSASTAVPSALGETFAAQATVREILAAAQDACPGSQVVIAWNQPMVKQGSHYLLGVPFSDRRVVRCIHQPAMSAQGSKASSADSIGIATLEREAGVKPISVAALVMI